MNNVRKVTVIWFKASHTVVTRFPLSLNRQMNLFIIYNKKIKRHVKLLPFSSPLLLSQFRNDSFCENCFRSTDRRSYGFADLFQFSDCEFGNLKKNRKE